MKQKITHQFTVDNIIEVSETEKNRFKDDARLQDLLVAELQRLINCGDISFVHEDLYLELDE